MLPRLISYIDLTTKLQTILPFGTQHWRLLTSFYSKYASFARDSRDSKSASGGLLCVFGSYTHVSISLVCKKQTQFLTAVHSLKLFRLMQAHEWTVYRRLNFGLETFSSKPAEGNLEHHTRERVIPSHILTIVYLSQLIRLRPAFPTSSRQWSKWSTNDEAQA